MSGDWSEVPLGEVVTLQRGFDLPAQDRKPGTVPIVSSSGITGYHSEVGVNGPGVVTGRYGTIGQVFLINDDYWPLNTTLWVKDFHGNDPQFVSYLLRTIDFHSCSDKSSVPGVNRNDLHRIPVLLPPLIEQLAIASLLGALDDKIELNRRMSATLDAIVRALFQSWFVDFDPVRAKLVGREPIGLDEPTAALFPARFQESRLGSIPEGWKVEMLSEVMTFQGGTQPPASTFIDQPRAGYVRLVQIRDFYTDSHVTFVPDMPQLRKFAIDDVMLARYGSSGNAATTDDSLGRVCRGLSGAYNVALVRVVPLRPYREFLYCFLKSETFQGAIKGMGARSVQSGFRKEDLNVISVVTAPAQVHQAFESAAEVFWRATYANTQQSSTLLTLRDTLLPRLLSGEIRLNQAEQDAEVIL